MSVHLRAAAHVWMALGLVFGMTAAQQLLHTPKVAAACPAEEFLFRHALDSGGFVITSSDGAQTTDMIRNRDLNPDCSDSEAHSTVHHTNAAVSRMAEVGWVELYDSFGNKTWKVFWEVAVGSGYICGFECGPWIGCCSNYKFRVVNVEGTTKWRFFLMPGASPPWLQIGPTGGEDAQFAEGIPMAETGRRGGTGTGASDLHEHLKRKLCGGCTWFAWQGNAYDRDTISNWHGERLTDDSYQVVRDT